MDPHKPTRDARRAALIAWFVLICGALLFGNQNEAQCQSTDRASQPDAIARFTEVLIRRPRPGIALDKVYSHHIQNLTLDDFLESLTASNLEQGKGERCLVAGLIHMRRGNYSDAVIMLRRAERMLPKNALARFQLGKAQLAEGDSSSAIKSFERAIQADPSRADAPDIYLTLGRLYAETDHHLRAVSVWKQLQTRFPSDTSISEKVARAMTDNRLYEPALTCYRDLERNAKSADQKVRYQIAIADLTQKTDGLEASRTQLEDILARLRPDSWLFRSVRDRLESGYMSMGDYQGLADLYRRQSNRSPNDISIVIRLGQILDSAGQSEDALRTLRTAVTRAPNNVAARVALIDTLIRNGEPSKACDHFETAAELDPGNPDLFVRWGQTILNQADLDKKIRQTSAAKIWRRLADAKSDDPVISVRIAELLGSIRHTDDAIVLYKRAIDLDADSPQYREYLGKYLHELGRTDQAIEVWESIASESRRNRDSLIRLAETLAAFKFDKRSLEIWNQASEFDLLFGQRVRYAKMLIDAGHHAQSIKQLDIAHEIAQTPDEKERVLATKIDAYQSSKTLGKKITETLQRPPTVENRRFLSLLYLAANQVSNAETAISDARRLNPTSIPVMRTAADIAIRQAKAIQANELYEQLADLDVQFRTTYLQKSITILRQTGNFSRALRNANSLIKTNPSSPESHRIFAEIAFQTGRHDQAEQALRNAIAISPRSNTNRLMLAKHLADEFETEAAIELYWQAIAYQNDWEGRQELVAAMQPLYERRGESDLFIRRIERLNVETGNAQTARRFVAAYWQSAGDFDQANLILRRLLAEQPADDDLIRQIVSNCVAAKDFTTAISYQKRLIELVNTPENVSQLVQLQLKAGVLTESEVFDREIDATDDPTIMIGIIQRAARSNQSKAIGLCRRALRRDDSLWGIKTVLAQMLCTSNATMKLETMQEAARLANEIGQLDLDAATRPPCRQYQSTMVKASAPPGFSGGNRSTNLATSAVPSALLTCSFVSKIVQQLTGTQKPRQSGPPGQTTQVPNYSLPVHYGQAIWIGRAVELLATVRESKMRGEAVSTRALTIKLFPMPAIEQTTKQSVLEEIYIRDSLAKYITGQTSNFPDPVLWRLIEIDDQGDHWAFELILNTLSNPRPRSNARLTSRLIRATPQRLTPLSDRNLAALTKAAKLRLQQIGQNGSNLAEIRRELRIRQLLRQEYLLLGKTAPVGLTDVPTDKPTSYVQAVSRIQMCLLNGNIELADGLSQSLAKVAREEKLLDANSDFLRDPEFAWTLAPADATERAFVDRNRVHLIDAWIAHCSRRAALSENANETHLIPLLFGEGRSQVVVPRSTGPRPVHVLFHLETTLSKRYIANHFLRGLIPLVINEPGARFDGHALILPPATRKRLATIPSAATPFERRLRGMTSAFAAYWDNDPEDCRAQLAKMANDHPNEFDIQIELARMEIQTDQRHIGFSRLDRLATKDNTSLLKAELAKIHLTLMIGDMAPAHKATEKLLATQWDKPTGDAINKSLVKLNLVPAPMNRTQNLLFLPTMTGRASVPMIRADQSVSRRLAFAQRCLNSGNPTKASEIAFSIILDRWGGRLEESYVAQQRAVDMIFRTGKVQPLLSATERQLTDDPSNEALRVQLAELYIFSGARIRSRWNWDKTLLSETIPPSKIIDSAEKMRRQRKHQRAAMLYLHAIDRDPDLWDRLWSVLAEVSEASFQKSVIYRRLARMDIRQFSMFSLCNMIQIRTGEPFNLDQRAFVQHVVETHPQTQEKLSLLKRFVPESERKHFQCFSESPIAAADKTSDEAGREISVPEPTE